SRGLDATDILTIGEAVVWCSLGCTRQQLLTRRGVEQWQLARLITWRSQVQILPPQLESPRLNTVGFFVRGAHCTRSSSPWASPNAGCPPVRASSRRVFFITATCSSPNCRRMRRRHVASGVYRRRGGTA